MFKNPLHTSDLIYYMIIATDEIGENSVPGSDGLPAIFKKIKRSVAERVWLTVVQRGTIWLVRHWYTRESLHCCLNNTDL